MKKSNYFLFATLIGILVLALVIGAALFGDSAKDTVKEPLQEDEARNQAINLPQLNEERADAATMVLISAPPLSPPDHAGRWNPELGQESCLMCHEQPEATGAREIPIDHFEDEDRSKGIFGPRNSCITCHGLDTGDTRRGFNRD